jgi:hypothetical protein
LRPDTSLWQHDPPQSRRLFPALKSLTIDQQKLGELRGVASIGLFAAPRGRLHEHHVRTAELVPQHLHQPVVEAADFQDRLEAAGRLGLLSHLFAKRFYENRKPAALVS